MALKLVPVRVTVVPTGPVVGENEVIVGVGKITVNELALVPVSDPTVTVMTPEVAPAGTTAAMLVAVLAVTVAVVPLNFTVLLAGVVLKFDPVMVTVVPIKPLIGLNVVTVGAVREITVKLVVLVTLFPFTVTWIGPVVAPIGTLVVMLVAVLEETAS